MSRNHLCSAKLWPAVASRETRRLDAKINLDAEPRAFLQQVLGAKLRPQRRLTDAREAHPLDRAEEAALEQELLIRRVAVEYVVLPDRDLLDGGRQGGEDGDVGFPAGEEDEVGAGGKEREEGRDLALGRSVELERAESRRDGAEAGGEGACGRV